MKLNISNEKKIKKAINAKTVKLLASPNLSTKLKLFLPPTN